MHGTDWHPSHLAHSNAMSPTKALSFFRVSREGSVVTLPHALHSPTFEFFGNTMSSTANEPEVLRDLKVLNATFMKGVSDLNFEMRKACEDYQSAARNSLEVYLKLSNADRQPCKEEGSLYLLLSFLDELSQATAVAKSTPTSGCH